MAHGLQYYKSMMTKQIIKKEKTMEKTLKQNKLKRRTGILGDCTGLSGDLDECEITEEDRRIFIDITNLVK